MIYTILDSKSPEGLLNVSVAFRAGKNKNNGRKRQTLLKDVEAEVYEYYCNEIETDNEESDNKVSDEDLVLDRENENSQETNSKAILSIFLSMNQNRLGN